MTSTKQEARNRRRQKTVKTVRGTAERPRLSVFRSNEHIYAQLIDDEAGKTLASASDIKMKVGKKAENAKAIGNEIAKIAKEKKIETCVFDRNGYKYHGRTQAVAEGAREGGLKF
ncbi:50S ribosomal protein L18 [Patescibacteria group bacterium]|nr:50S ribosomal protein L18 [Patescibacteria group bacterium]